MTASTDIAAHRAAASARGGGPEERSRLLEHVAGWTLVVVLAMLIVQLHLM